MIMVWKDHWTQCASIEKVKMKSIALCSNENKQKQKMTRKRK